jgi:galactoside O-acetyltransferase
VLDEGNMDSFYSEEELQTLGFHSLGIHVKVSRKASIYEAEKISLGNHVRVDDFCILSGRIEIGNYVHVAAYTALYGGQDGIFIGDFANLSSRVSVYSLNDDYSGETMTSPTVAEQYKNVESKPVYIGKHVVVGSTSVILPGITLQIGSAFGSFSFINHDSEEWSVNAGIPARKIKDRKKNLLELERKMMEDMQK